MIFEFSFLPPSVNGAYYTDFNNRTRHKTGKYREFEKALHPYFPTDRIIPDYSEGELIVEYNFYFPDKRRRDVANYEKCLTDSLVSWGVIGDDSQIVRMVLEKYYAKGKPLTVVRIEKN